VLWTEAIIKRVAGVKPRYFRFPGGCLTQADVRLVASLGEQSVQWDVVSGDSFLTDPARVESEVLRQVRPGSIVVMHLVGPARTPATAPALRNVIPKLRARGYRFVTLKQLLRQP
jgi:peptidoglycan/xylan/chitin deacetylase (PgdA/CDA1 family)